jgi:integrase
MREQAVPHAGTQLIIVAERGDEAAFTQQGLEKLAALELQPVSLAPQNRPAYRYLEGTLGQSSRRTMLGALYDLVLMLFAQFPDPKQQKSKRNTHPSAEEQEARRLLVYIFPWESLRVEHTSALRARLVDLVDDATYKPSTSNQHLAALRGILRAAWEMNLMSTDCYYRAINIKDISGESETAGRSLEDGEIERILAACISDPTVKGCRDLAILQLLYITGLRRAEVAGLDRDDYSISTQEVKIRRSKRRKGRTVYLKAEGPRQALEAWLGFRGDAPGPLFLHIRRGGHIVWRSALPPTHSDEEALGQVKETPNLQNLKRKSGRVRAAQERKGEQDGILADDHLSDQAIYNVVVERAAEAGIADLTPHDFRRNHIGDMLTRGIDLSIAQDLAGHANPKTTKNYDPRREMVRADAAAKIDAPCILWQPGVPRRQTRHKTVKPD